MYDANDHRLPKDKTPTISLGPLFRMRSSNLILILGRAETPLSSCCIATIYHGEQVAQRRQNRGNVMNSLTSHGITPSSQSNHSINNKSSTISILVMKMKWTEQVSDSQLCSLLNSSFPKCAMWKYRCHAHLIWITIHHIYCGKSFQTFYYILAHMNVEMRRMGDF